MDVSIKSGAGGPVRALVLFLSCCILFVFVPTVFPLFAQAASAGNADIAASQATQFARSAQAVQAAQDAQTVQTAQTAEINQAAQTAEINQTAQTAEINQTAQAAEINQVKQIEVSGKVVDVNGEPLAGVYMLIVGTQNGTSTDVDGFYKLKAPADAVLEFSLIGFATQRIALLARTVMQELPLRELPLRERAPPGLLCWMW